MKPKLNLVVASLAVFALYFVLIGALRFVMGKLPFEDGILGVYRTYDFIIAFVVVVGFVITTLAQKRKLNK